MGWAASTLRFVGGVTALGIKLDLQIDTKHLVSRQNPFSWISNLLYEKRKESH